MFGDSGQIKENIENIITGIISSHTAKGQSRIYYAGEKENESRDKSVENGIKIDLKTVKLLAGLAEKASIELPEGLTLK